MSKRSGTEFEQSLGDSRSYEGRMKQGRTTDLGGACWRLQQALPSTYEEAHVPMADFLADC